MKTYQVNTDHGTIRYTVDRVGAVTVQSKPDELDESTAAETARADWRDRIRERRRELRRWQP